MVKRWRYVGNREGFLGWTAFMIEPGHYVQMGDVFEASEERARNFGAAFIIEEADPPPPPPREVPLVEDTSELQEGR